MSKLIIPEIVREQIIPNSNKTLNIKFNQNIDKRQYEIDHRTYTSNTTNNTINNNQGGFFRFIFNTLILPFKLIYNGITYIFVKYDLKEKLRLERIAIKKDKLKRKLFNSKSNMWGMDEIY